MNRLFYSFVLFILIFSVKPVYAASDTLKIPVNRQYFHDKVDNEQKACDRLDGKLDHQFNITRNEEVNLQLTDVLYRKVDALQEWIELSEKFEKSNEKVKLLTYTESLLKLFRQSIKKKEITAVEFPNLMNTLDSAFQTGNLGFDLAAITNRLSYESANIFVHSFADHPNQKEAQKIVYYKFCLLHPDVILSTIKPYVDEPFADSLLVVACRFSPSQIYTYAQSLNSPEGKLIHRSEHPLVKTVAKLSQTPNALLYFPFLDDIISGKKTVEQIGLIIGDGEVGYDSVAYFKLLVSTEIDYFKRMTSVQKDTPIAMFGTNGLRESLKEKAIRHFITPINELHNENNLNVRMKAIDSLSSVDLYYMMVMGESEIYTSSYKHSFNRLLQRLGPKPRCDSMLLAVHFDYFKKFIKMAANYNKLDTFLKTMPPKSSETLMKAFVSNLDQSGSLEDATDVADSYSSINNKILQKKILQYIQENRMACLNENNDRGAMMYELLGLIFLSADSTNRINLTQLAGIPSIFDIDRKNLEDDSGRIVQQVFFYGDDDGKAFFPSFLNSFSSKEWKIEKKPEWVEISSLKGNVWVYANLPLESDANLDDSAQFHLNIFLEENGIAPKIVVHRGHSYWLPGTIKRMPQDAKIVVLGSCGGYKNLNKILEVSPDAHIISTKEIGAGDINRPIMNYINDCLIKGKNIAWRDMWKSLTTAFNSDKSKTVKESWENYIPPYRNLGAIFIKAYHKKIDNLSL